MSETLAREASARAPRDAVASRPPPHLKLVMATQDLSEITRATSVDRSSSGDRGGSIGMVLLVAIALVGAAVGLLLVGRGNAGPYILGLLAFLAMAGVFSLFALATGILRVAGKDTGASPMLKMVVEDAVYRLLKAAREGRRAQEEVRVTGLKKVASWLRLRVRPLGDAKGGSKLTL